VAVAAGANDLHAHVALDHRAQGERRGAGRDVVRGQAALLVTGDSLGARHDESLDVRRPFGRELVLAPVEPQGEAQDRGVAIDDGDDTGQGGVQLGARIAVALEIRRGRVEYVGVRGLTVAASFWTGRSGFRFRPRFDVPVKLGEADVRYSRDRLPAWGAAVTAAATAIAADLAS